MNERIQELLAQCTQESIDGLFANPYVDQEKFAELLVRECAMFVVTELEGKVGSLIADTTANRLEEHFGVEQ